MLGAVHECRALILEKHLDTFGHVDNAAHLELTIGLFDLAARRLIRPTPEWVKAMGLRPEDLAGPGGRDGEARA